MTRRLGWRRRRVPTLDLKVTTPGGTMVSVDTFQLYAAWQVGRRTNDGYVDMLEEFGSGGRVAALRLWVKPAGWTEPDRTAALDGTGALPDGYRR